MGQLTQFGASSFDPAEGFRTEHDTMGEVLVPQNALWGAQTQRAVDNFPISHTPLHKEHILALIYVKKACAIANRQLGIISPNIADAIIHAADTVLEGDLYHHFPIDVYQTGSGTSSNMNANEVLAAIASRYLKERFGPDAGTVHPNDHVNASQSSNDVFPTSAHIAVARATSISLLPALHILHESLTKKAKEWQDKVKPGRTHLMDATPITFGQEFLGYATQISKSIQRINNTLPSLLEVALGGTATGTGINTPQGFADLTIRELAQLTQLNLTRAQNHFEAQSARDAMVEAHSALKSLAVSLIKICNDLRLMGSGPNTGLGELYIPDLQPGSSIMPGKVNPVVLEVVLMVASKVIGNDATVTYAGSSGLFELNVQIPVMTDSHLQSLTLLTNSSICLAEKVIDGLRINAERALALARSSPSIVTPLNRVIGYENAAKVAKYAIKEGITIHDAVIALGFVKNGAIKQEELERLLDVGTMTRPNL